MNAAFKHYPSRPAQLTPEFLESEYASILELIDRAEPDADAKLWIDALKRWNSLGAYVGGERSRIHYGLSGDVTAPHWEAAEKNFREHLQPIEEKQCATILSRMFASRCALAIRTQLGSHFWTKLECQRFGVAPENAELRPVISEKLVAHSKLQATATIEFRGQSLTLSALRNLSNSPDAAIRKESFLKFWGWYQENRPVLSQSYHELVQLRDQMGRNLGMPDFIELGYRNMNRTDYGPEEVQKFRAAILQHLVPLQTEIFSQQAQALGQDVLHGWDAGYDPRNALPLDVAPIPTQLEKAQGVFDRISPRLAKHFARMRGEKLIDLEARPGKQPGAYCTSFPDEGRVAIFCNSVGGADDVSTLMHEMGHAFQGWESQAIEWIDLQWPTLEAAEVHSMGMEYLSLRYIEEFFSPEDARRFRRKRWQASVLLICYCAIVDEYQHWVYRHPQATPETREQEWVRIWKLYRPGLSYEGAEFAIPLRAYAQNHIYQMPFYYIDYAMAEMGAMQLAILDQTDEARTKEIYLALCQAGGTLSMKELFTRAGLKLPFGEEALGAIAQTARRELQV